MSTKKPKDTPRNKTTTILTGNIALARPALADLSHNIQPLLYNRFFVKPNQNTRRYPQCKAATDARILISDQYSLQLDILDADRAAINNNAAGDFHPLATSDKEN